MPQTIDYSLEERAEKALVDVLEEQGGPLNVAEMIKRASRAASSAALKRAYWHLVTAGDIIPDSSGNIILRNRE